MKIIYNPKNKNWPKLCIRPEVNSEKLNKTVSLIMLDVKKYGDLALRKYAEKFDKIKLKQIACKLSNLDFSSIDKDFKKAISTAKKNIEKFHRPQGCSSYESKISNSIICGRRVTAIEKVGLYIPGGQQPLISSLLMLTIPAQIAGCKEITICTPPSAITKNPQNNKNMISPKLAYVCKELGINNIYLSGGAQAIAALAYGTKSIPNVFKIFGPGNQYVNEAKKQVAATGKVGIDLPAGPTELLIIADNSSDPRFVAADLISQAEHGRDSQVVLVSTSEKILLSVIKEIKKQLPLLPRKETINHALKSALFIYFPKLTMAIEFANFYAPEHLIIATKNSSTSKATNNITSAGSIFLGNYSAESAGDYCSGTNHTLPTNGAARFTGGVSVESFQKTISYQHISQTGISSLAPSIKSLALSEGLEAHANAALIRIKKIRNNNI